MLNWIERYAKATSNFVVLHIHLAFVLEDGRLYLVNVLLVRNSDLDDLVGDYLVFIVRPGEGRGRDYTVDEFSHVDALLEHGFEDVVR